MAQLALSPGLFVGTRFRLDRLVGQGGTSCVWAATNMATAKPVALKFLKRPAAPTSTRHRRFLREPRATIDHPNVVRIYDCLSLNDAMPFMVMELLRGRTLAEEMRHSGKLSAAAACSVLRPVVSAVGAAHARGIIHRDLKPQNIFLSQEMDGCVAVKVLDFGIAKLAMANPSAPREPALTEAGTRIGTVGYSAPEQASGDDVDHRADTWALGVVLYECLTGIRPFPCDRWVHYLTACQRSEPEPVQRLSPQVPLALAALVHRMLSLDPSFRPSLQRVFDELGAYCPTPSPPFEAPLTSLLSGEQEPLLDTISDEGRSTQPDASTRASEPTQAEEPTRASSDGGAEDLDPSAADLRPWAHLRWRAVAACAAAAVFVILALGQRAADDARMTADVVLSPAARDSLVPMLNVPPSAEAVAPNEEHKVEVTSKLYRVFIDPPDASVEIDGKKVLVKDGFILLQDTSYDNVLAIRLSKDGIEHTFPVWMTRVGPSHHNLRLDSRPPPSPPSPSPAPVRQDRSGALYRLAPSPAPGRLVPPPSLAQPADPLLTRPLPQGVTADTSEFEE